jgi:hypothetical protein
VDDIQTKIFSHSKMPRWDISVGVSETTLRLEHDCVNIKASRNRNLPQRCFKEWRQDWLAEWMWLMGPVAIRIMRTNRSLDGAIYCDHLRANLRAHHQPMSLRNPAWALWDKRRALRCKRTLHRGGANVDDGGEGVRERPGSA